MAAQQTEYNPCFCWNLKDGCMIIGIWSLIWSIIQLGLFSWQTAVVKYLRDRMENRRVPTYQGYSVYQNRLGGGDWNEVYITPEEKIYFALFIVQILNLIAAFGLLFASVALIYGVHTNSKLLIWPWFPCIVASIICAIAYCILWWIGNAQGYWLALTVIQCLTIVINTYCVFCVLVQYRRILKGHVQRKRKDEYPPKPVIYEYKTEEGHGGELFDDYKEKSGAPPIDDRLVNLCYLNASYEHEPPPATKVSLFSRPEQHEPLHHHVSKHVVPPDRDRMQPVYGVEQILPITDGIPCGQEQPAQQPIEWVSYSAEHMEPVETSGNVEVQWDRQAPSAEDQQQIHISEEKRSDKSRRSKSKEALTDRESRSRSKSRPTSEEDDEEHRRSKNDKSRRSRSESGHHRHHRCKECEREERKEKKDERHSDRRSSKCRCRKTLEKDTCSSRRSVRDVKRDDKAKKRASSSSRDKAPKRPDSGSTLDSYGHGEGGKDNQQLPAPQSHHAFGGGISIPQHIVIPAQPNRTAPQTYQISSEVTISYNNSDKSAPTSDSERARSRGQQDIVQGPQKNGHFPAKIGHRPATGTMPTGVSESENAPAVVSRPTSSESKARGTTAV